MSMRHIPQTLSVESRAPRPIGPAPASINDSIVANADGAGDVPAGYKRTKVGTIPENWEVVSVEELFTFERTASNSRSDLAPSGAVAYVHYGDLHTRFNHFIDVSHAQLPHLSESGNVTATLLRDGDLVVADASEDEVGVGKSAEIREAGSKKAISGLHTFLLRSRDKRVCHGYRGYLLESKPVKQQIKRSTTGLKVFGISKAALAKVLIPLPSFTQQRAIAEALSDVDGLLESLDALIAKKQAIKKATMQQLLTGKTRLPGCSGAWKTRMLGDHVRFLRHGSHARSELTNDDAVKYLHYGDIHKWPDPYFDPSASVIPTLPGQFVNSLDLLEDGDLILVDASEDIAGVGKSVEFKALEDQQAVSGLHTIAARFNKSVLADGFKAYLQFCPPFRDHLRRLAAGTKVYATNRTHIASIEMELPALKEQRDIAAVLSSMDAEIAALETRREKTLVIKKGMMQQLLTGQVRLL